MRKKAKLTAILLTMVLLMTMFPVSPTFAEAKENNDLSIFDFSSQLNGLIEEYDEPYFEEITLSTEETKQLSAIISENNTSFENALAISEAENPNDVEAQEPTTFKAKKASSKVQIEKEKEEAAVAESIVTQSASEEGFAVEKSSDGSLTVSKPFQTKRIIVKSDKKPVDDKAVAVVGGYHDIYVLQYETEVEAEIALSELSGRKDIEFAQADGVVSACDDYMSWGYGENYMNQSNYLSWLGSSKPDLEEVTVAVIDTGVAYDHEFFKGRVDTENDYDFVNDDSNAYDDHYHGTHVAGTIAEGTGSNVKILPIKVLNVMGSGTEMQIYLGICYATRQNVDVINMSLGGSGKSFLDEEAINDATEKGIIVCVAAGNDNDDAANHTPANVESAVTVAAVDEDMKLASFSNYGDCVDIAAPGVGINSCIPYDKNDENAKKYDTLNGTSMATPHVAAACAALKSYSKDIRTEDALNYFSETALEVNTNQGMGVGFICMTDILSTDASKLSLGDVSLSMFPDQQYTIKGITIPQADITWSSSDENIASVSGGTVKAKKNGSCVITAEANGQTRECGITVSELSMSLDTEPFTTYVGLDTYINYTVSHKNTIRFYSSDENVFTVSKAGKVTATGIGQALLTAVAGENTASEVKASIAITTKDVGDWYDENAQEYIIENAEQLFEISVLSYRGKNFDGKTIKISDDVDEIDLSVYPAWLPIGLTTDFKGVFDGNNKPIVGMRDSGYAYTSALFASIRNSTVKNTVISAADLKAYTYCAGIAALAADSVIDNCRVDGSIVSDNKAGGICAEMIRTTMINCVNRASITAKRSLGGGIVGISWGTSVIENCINCGEINAYTGGGITGAAWYGLVFSYGPDASGAIASQHEINRVVNCVNIGKAKRGIANIIGGSEVSGCYYLDRTSLSGYNVFRYVESDSGYICGEPEIHSFSDALVTDNDMSLISCLNSYVYYINDSRDDIRLYTWGIDKNLPTLTRSTVTDRPVLWLPDYEDKIIYTGEDFKAEVLSNIENPSVTWQSSDPSIASVTPDGTVTGISCGNAVITAICSEERIRLSYNVEVIEIGEWYTQAQDYYGISNAKELNEFAKLINLGLDNFEGKYVYLKNDIDLSGIDNWLPIGYANAKSFFAGTFDGKNNRILHLNISSLPYSTGFFGTIAPGAVIENVVLYDFNIRAIGNYNNGALCARMEEGATVRNCITGKGIIRSVDSSIGNIGYVSGLVGLNNGGLIENCVNNAYCVAKYCFAAGICGSGYGDINNCVNNGRISGYWYLAGIIARPSNEYSVTSFRVPTISNCTNNGEILLTAYTSRPTAAGIILYNFGKIVNCVNNGTVSGPEDNKNTYGCGINDYDNIGYEFCMDNVVNEGSVINSEYNYAIGRIEKDHTFRTYYLDSSSSEAALFENEDAKEELFAYTSDRILEDGQNLVDVLNANVDELNQAAGDPEYFHWYVDSDNHLRIGDECQHTLVDYVYFKYPDCENTGERRLQCLMCGKPFSDTEVVSAKGHTIPEDYAYVCESTCSSHGYRYKRCAVCNQDLSETYETLPLLPHTVPEDYAYVWESTCSTQGYRYKNCAVCNQYLSETYETLPLLPHTESEEYVIGYEATCQDTGYKYKVCTVCHSIIPGSTVTIPKAEHKADGGEIISYPTCCETGLMLYRCTYCSRVIDIIELETTDHNIGPDGKCTVCGIELADGCTCNCHKSGFIGFIWKIQRLFYKLFRTNKTCACGKLHY